MAGTLFKGYKGEHFAEVVVTVKAVNPTEKPTTVIRPSKLRRLRCVERTVFTRSGRMTFEDDD